MEVEQQKSSMSKIRVSKIKNNIEQELGKNVSTQQIAETCRKLNISFKDHEQMGIHYNSVLAETDAQRIAKAFKDQPGGAPKPKAAPPARETHSSSAPAPSTETPSRPEASAPRIERTDSSHRENRSPASSAASTANTNTSDRPVRTDRPDRPERGDRPVRTDRPDRPERGERPIRSDRPDRGDRPPLRDYTKPRPVGTDGRSSRPPGTRGERPIRSDRPDRGDRPPLRDYTKPRPVGADGRSSRPPGSRAERPIRSDRPPLRDYTKPRPVGTDGRSSRPPAGAGAGRGRTTTPTTEDRPERIDRPPQRDYRGGSSTRGPGGAPGRPGGAPGGPRFGPNRGPAGRFPTGPKRGRRKRSKYKKEKLELQKQELKVELSPEEKIIELHTNITVTELAVKMQIGVAEVMKALFMKGMVTNINQALELETAEAVAKDLEYEVLMPTTKEKEEMEKPKLVAIKPTLDQDPAKLHARPPVVTIMGHVDHGKTSLLDYIRKTKVTEGEAGGITQHIGAYMVKVDGRDVAFLDTPGHEAFTAMRARGAQVTDIAIIVIAADDGIMPQTVEAINHAKAAGVQIIIAVNKMDKPGADLDRSKQQLTEHELVAEEWGGDAVIVPVSAKTGEGVDDLLEMIVLLSDILELKSNPDKPASGVVIESQLEKGRGSVGTVLIQNGTLKQGDAFVVGPISGRVRAMTNEHGKKLKEAGASYPVEILGFADVPTAGDIFQVVKNDKTAKSMAETRKFEIEEEARNRNRMNLSSLYENMLVGSVKELSIVVKTDVQGSIAAIRQSLEQLTTEKVHVHVIHAATGEISQHDVMLATASDALVVGFNVKADNNAERIAEQEQIEIRYYEIIYKLIEDIENAMEGMLEPEMVEVEMGKAEVRAVFKISKAGTIAGSYMLEGKAERNCQVRVKRGEELLHTGRLSSLKRFKDDVKEVGNGYEFGLAVKDFNDLVEGDIVEFFQIKARHEIAKA